MTNKITLPIKLITREPAHAARPVPPEAFFICSAIFHYLGPAFAVLLFARVDVLGVAWLRIASAAVVFAVWKRPWRLFAELDAGERRTVIALGFVLAIMNVCFYLAIDRLPLATVGTIEFLGPIALAALGVRTMRNLAALLLACGSVFLLTSVRISGERSDTFSHLRIARCSFSTFCLGIGLPRPVAAVELNVWHWQCSSRALWSLRLD